MKSFQKIAVIGGTGKSGTYLVQELLAKGYKVNLLIRNPEKIPENHPNLKVVLGDVTSGEKVEALIKNCDAVISTLGLGIPASAPDLFEKATEIVVKTMKSLGLDRYILISGLNVNTPFDQKSEKNLQATAWMEQTFPKSTRSKQKEYELLQESGLNWTLVRLPLIELKEGKVPIRTDLRDCKGDKINAASLAVFLIDQLESGEFIQKAPFLFNV
ncbi:NAD(P)-dependent oxidoreductase [Algoriphagus sp. PAP.12]|uniref:NAD(P)-dependent oxidoreductase n=1 Tax=Algoriphagus sp. PAP.12 TaxID=2996678 RepID=UPI00227B0313|nr:NAD(P)H-binding protein [Algoriphagus sp. PAP.12]